MHTTGQQPKRRRLELGGLPGKPHPIAPSTGYSITMQSATTFSVSSTSIHSGFRSAGAHLQDLAQRKSGSVTEIDQDTSLTRESTARSSNLNKKSNASIKHHRNEELNKTNSGQGTLLNFFHQPPNGGCAAKEHPAQEASPPLLMGSKQAETPPNLREGARPLSQSRQPMQPIPQPLAEHRLKSAPIPTRPPKIPQGPDHNNKQYPFFSSSPPPIESLIEEAEASDETALYVDKSHDQNRTQTESQTSDSCSAMTFHVTTTTQVRSAQTTTRTLGVRRSMNGWTNRGGHTFSVTGRRPGRKVL